MKSSVSRAQRQHHPSQLPWYRRWVFITVFLLAFTAYALFVMPTREALNAVHTVALGVSILMYLVVLMVIQLDRKKPLWLKNLTAFGLFALLGWIFYRYSGARWEALGRNLFNLGVMAEGNNWLRLWRGLWIAVQVFVYSLAFSTLLALFVAVVRSIVNDKFLNIVIDGYTDVFRAVPPIALLLIVYSALPYSGIVLSPFATGVLTLTLIETAYLGEVFRAGIEAIHKNQLESARSLGLTAWQTMKLVVLPQAVRIVLPDYTNRLIGLMKRTAETSVIAIAEVLQTAQQIQSAYVNATPLMVGAGMYMLVLLPLTRLASYLERTRQRAH